MCNLGNSICTQSSILYTLQPWDAYDRVYKEKHGLFPVAGKYFLCPAHVEEKNAGHADSGGMIYTSRNTKHTHAHTHCTLDGKVEIEWMLLFAKENSLESAKIDCWSSYANDNGRISAIFNRMQCKHCICNIAWYVQYCIDKCERSHIVCVCFWGSHAMILKTIIEVIDTTYLDGSSKVQWEAVSSLRGPFLVETFYRSKN